MLQTKYLLNHFHIEALEPSSACRDKINTTVVTKPGFVRLIYREIPFLVM